MAVAWAEGHSRKPKKEHPKKEHPTAACKPKPGSKPMPTSTSKKGMACKSPTKKGGKK